MKKVLRENPDLSDFRSLRKRAGLLFGKALPWKYVWKYVNRKNGRLVIAGPCGEACVHRVEVKPGPIAPEGNLPAKLRPSAGDVDSLIPKPLPAYQTRWIGAMKDMEFLRYMHDLRQPVLLEGETGCGKTWMVHEYAARNRLPFLWQDLSAGSDEALLVGFRDLDGGRTVWRDGIVTRAMRLGIILLLEEINMLDKRTASAIYTAIHERRIVLQQNDFETVVAHDRFMAVATQNPRYAGSLELNDALRNRFSPVRILYDRAMEESLVGDTKFMGLVDTLRKAYDTGLIRTPVSTRTLLRFAQHKKDHGLEMALYLFLQGFKQEDEPVVREEVEKRFPKRR